MPGQGSGTAQESPRVRLAARLVGAGGELQIEVDPADVDQLISGTLIPLNVPVADVVMVFCALVWVCGPAVPTSALLRDERGDVGHQIPRQLCFVALLQCHTAIPVQQYHRIVVAIEADLRVGDVIGDNKIKTLVGELTLCIDKQIFGFRREAYSEGFRL